VAIDSKFAESLICRRYSVLDKPLKPFSLWHYSALCAINNSWAFGEYNPFLDTEEIFAELYQAVCICSKGFDPELKALDIEVEDRHKQQRLGELAVSLADHIKLFKTYLNDHCAGPEFWEKEGSKGVDTGIPAIGQLLGVLLQCGFSEKEAWEMPMGRAQFYAAFIICSQPGNTSGPRWVTDKQRENITELSNSGGRK
jgi:hypothetical protein